RSEIAVLLGRATAIDPDWLAIHFPKEFRESSQVIFNAQERRVMERHIISFQDLVIEDREVQGPSAELAANLLAQEILEGRLVLKHWSDSVEQWITRLNLLAESMPELEIAPIGTREDRQLIFEQICFGALNYKDIKDHPVWPVLKAWLSAQQLAALDYYLPCCMTLPNQKRPAPVRYEKSRAILSATVQDLYDVNPAKLSIAQGRIPLVIEVLAPNRRPVQVTQDLNQFWETSYPQIKKDLKGRYPKHEWR
ncbi:MAG TPA: ATP-dependent helicase C-terminal domain-containing protein, partial [Opitutales bacterium]|nr:ATP-dependent helicase C-terminal domain-containing protein [Opitutales bacterium]